jgi:hypothetical protein
MNDLIVSAKDLIYKLGAQHRPDQQKVVKELTDALEAAEKRLAYHRSGCACDIAEDGETIVKWCAVHFEWKRRAEAAEAKNAAYHGVEVAPIGTLAALERQLAEAQAEMRERCAKVAEFNTMALSCSRDGHGIAAAVRALPTDPLADAGKAINESVAPAPSLTVEPSQEDSGALVAADHKP